MQLSTVDSCMRFRTTENAAETGKLTQQKLEFDQVGVGSSCCSCACYVLDPTGACMHECDFDHIHRTPYCPNICLIPTEHNRTHCGCLASAAQQVARCFRPIPACRTHSRAPRSVDFGPPITNEEHTCDTRSVQSWDIWTGQQHSTTTLDCCPASSQSATAWPI